MMPVAGRRPFTVLMTADAVGGVWSYALGLIAGSPQVRFVLAVMGPPPSEAQRRAAQALENCVVEMRPYRLEWMRHAAADVAASREWLARLAGRHGADLVHVNGYGQARLDCACPVLCVAHSDVVSWWMAVHGEEPPPEWQGYREDVVAGLRAASAVAAPTQAVIEDLRRHYELRPADVFVIPNGIDMTRFAPRPKHRVIMAAGRLWDEAKNLRALDAIAPELDWPVEIAGDAAHPESGTAQFTRSRLLGILRPDEMAERLGSAAIFAAPALYEPFGLGILEAAASGCALVLGDIASLRESWDGAALFVKPDDRAGLTAALHRLVHADDERRHLAAAARERSRRFTRVAMARRYAQLYRALGSGGQRREVA
jgi:glycogen(starch) synthase